MATINKNYVSAKMFAPTDAYYYTVDNRPIWEVLKDISAVNDEVEDLILKSEEIVSWDQETPLVETGIGGPYLARYGGVIVDVFLGMKTGGSSSDHVVDVNINGVTVFTTQANRPVLAFDNSLKIVRVTGVNLQNKVLAVNDLITVDVDQIQAGSPRWLKVFVVIKRTQEVRDADDYSLQGDPLDVTYTP